MGKKGKKTASVQVAGGVNGVVRRRARETTDAALVMAQVVEEAGVAAVTKPVLALAATVFARSAVRKCPTSLASAVSTRFAPIVE